MQAAVYYGKDDLRIEALPVPEISAGEVLVRVRSSGICGSDVMHWYRAGRGPLVLGHEIAGEIVAVGEGVTRYQAGDRIAAAHHVPCNTCHYCRTGHHTVCETLRKTNFYPGGFAEYLRLPPINVDRGIFPLPEEMSFDEATFIEPLACVYRGQRIAGMEMGKSVLVIGSGISGLLHIQLARALGAALIISTDIDPFRMKAARQLGADHVVSAAEDVPAALRGMNRGRPADLVILTAGAPAAIKQAFASVDRGGTILFFAPASQGTSTALPVNELFWRNEITLTSSYAANYEEHMRAMELIRQKKIDVRPMISHTLPLAGVNRGFQLVEEAKESIKVIINP